MAPLKISTLEARRRVVCRDGADGNSAKDKDHFKQSGFRGHSQNLSPLLKFMGLDFDKDRVRVEDGLFSFDGQNLMACKMVSIGVIPVKLDQFGSHVVIVATLLLQLKVHVSVGGRAPLALGDFTQ
jgi:hypothetical protein